MASAGLFFKLNGSIFIKDYGTRVVRNAVKKSIDYGLKVIKENTPVDTGNLQRNWRAGKNSFTDYRQDVLTNTVFYGIYVDEGTRYISPRRFVKRSADQIETYFLDTLQAEINRLNR
jgi:Bacteriophage HK97-gp10, putative tail-component